MAGMLWMERVRPLPENIRRRWERASGVELGDVRVHENSPLPWDFGADGLAMGRDIHLAPGCKKLLLHELVHVIQQKQGRVSAEREEELETEARLERPPVPCPPAEPTPAMQFCKWCGDRNCVLSAPLCRMGRIAKMHSVETIVRRVHSVDPSFGINGYGEQTWNGDVEKRPGFLRAISRYIWERDVDSRTRQGKNWVCPYCEQEFESAEAGDMEIDHYIPWAEYMRQSLNVDRLGTLPKYVAVALVNDHKNLVAACGSCNASKGDRKPGTPEFESWKAERKRLAGT